MEVTPIRIAVAAALVLALAFAWYHEGRSRWRARFADRWLHGLPVGTAVTVVLVVAFYLLAQGGWRHWGDPLVLPFVSWSYFYPTGLLASGVAHASPEHLISNLAGTLALGPIAEYAWGHYPPARRGAGSGNSAGEARRGGPLATPWVRALVLFPAALLGAALLTAVFSLGPGLGFSGAVYAIGGFAVVTVPLATVVAIVAASGLGTLYNALSQPVVRATIEPGTPGPPEWAGVGFQAHLLGFLLGALCAIGLLWYRRQRPDLQRVFFATLLFGLVQSLWLIAWSGGEDVYVMYRGVGVVLVVVLTILVAVAAAGSDRRLPRPLSVLPYRPTRRQLAVAWLGFLTLGLALGVVGALQIEEPAVLVIGPLVVLVLLLALPALPPVLPDRWLASPLSRRRSAIGVLAVFALLVALPAVPLGLVVVGGETTPGTGSVDLGDYTVAYAENATSGHEFPVGTGEDDALASEQSGLVVVSDEREIWTVGVREAVLEHEGNGTVHVGGAGWREAVRAQRTGWTAVGNDTAYVVDLYVDGDRTRSFESGPVRVNARIAGRAIDVVPTADGFELSVSRDGETVGSAPIPPLGESTTVDDLQFATRTVAGEEHVIAEAGETTVQIVRRESY